MAETKFIPHVSVPPAADETNDLPSESAIID